MTTGLGFALAVCSAFAVVALAAPARAEPAPEESSTSPHRLVWRDEWPRFRTIEYGITANLAWQLAFIEFRLKAGEPRWHGGVLIDDDVRNAIRASDPDVRESWAFASDPLTIGTQAVPVVIDAVLIPLAFDGGNFDVAWQMTMMNLEAMAAVGVFNRVGHRIIKRARPPTLACEQDDDADPFCGSGTAASFPSGHASGAFLGAGMSCAHHVHLPLYGGGWPDYVFGCILPVGLASSSSVFRLIADRHYFSDVVVGAAAGFAGGFGLPTLLHYGYGGDAHEAGDGPSRLMILPAVGAGQLGVSVGSAF